MATLAVTKLEADRYQLSFADVSYGALQDTFATTYLHTASPHGSEKFNQTGALGPWLELGGNFETRILTGIFDANVAWISADQGLQIFTWCPPTAGTAAERALLKPATNFFEVGSLNSSRAKCKTILLNTINGIWHQSNETTPLVLSASGSTLAVHSGSGIRILSQSDFTPFACRAKDFCFNSRNLSRVKSDRPAAPRVVRRFFYRDTDEALVLDRKPNARYEIEVHYLTTLDESAEQTGKATPFACPAWTAGGPKGKVVKRVRTKNWLVPVQYPQYQCEGYAGYLAKYSARYRLYNGHTHSFSKWSTEVPFLGHWYFNPI